MNSRTLGIKIDSRIKAVEAKIAALEQAKPVGPGPNDEKITEAIGLILDRLVSAEERIALLEAKRGPGRPPKDKETP